MTKITTSYGSELQLGLYNGNGSFNGILSGGNAKTLNNGPLAGQFIGDLNQANHFIGAGRNTTSPFAQRYYFYNDDTNSIAIYNESQNFLNDLGFSTYGTENIIDLVSSDRIWVELTNNAHRVTVINPDGSQTYYDGITGAAVGTFGDPSITGAPVASGLNGLMLSDLAANDRFLGGHRVGAAFRRSVFGDDGEIYLINESGGYIGKLTNTGGLFVGGPWDGHSFVSKKKYIVDVMANAGGSERIVTLVPEPSSSLLLISAISMLLFNRRRK